MSEERPPELPRPKARLPFEQQRTAGAVRRGAILVYGALTVGLTGLALYASLVAGHPATSGYVAAPAIGAAWFALRLYMMLGSKS